MTYRALRAPALAVFLLLPAHGCDSPTGDPGQGAIPVLQPASPQRGELTASEEEDRFRLAVADGRSVQLSVTSESPSPADTLVAEVYGAVTGAVYATATGVGGSPAAPGRSGWVEKTPDEELRARVRRGSAGAGGGYRIGFAERLKTAQKLPLGTVVAGETYAPRDDASYLFDAPPSGEVIIFIGHPAESGARFDVAIFDGTTAIASFRTPGLPGPVTSFSTPHVRLPRAGTFALRVVAVDRAAPFQLMVQGIDRQPEAAPAALRRDEVWPEEEIAPFADVDEYRFDGTAGDEVSIVFQILEGLSTGLWAELLWQGERVGMGHSATASPTLDGAGTGRLVLPGTGEYVLRVHGALTGDLQAGVGRYRLEVFTVDRSPERADGTLRLSVPITTESIDRPGDVDEFTFHAEPGHLVVLHLDDPTRAAPGFGAALLDPDGAKVVGAYTVAGSNDDGPIYSYRAPLTTSGVHTLRVTGAGALIHGPYEVELYAVDLRPESRSEEIRVGEVVTGESIDRPGEVDRFVLRGERGQEVNVFVGWETESAEALYVRAPGGILSGSGPSTLDGRSTGRFRLRQAVDTITVLAGLGAQPVPWGTGAYRLRVFPIDRRPEGVPSALALGDTLRTEPIYPAGDIDEYTFTAAVGDSLRIFFRRTADESLGLQAQVVDRSTGKFVHVSTAARGQPTQADFVAPTTGEYLVRVFQYSYEAPHSPDLVPAMGRYTLSVHRR